MLLQLHLSLKNLNYKENHLKSKSDLIIIHLGPISKLLSKLFDLIQVKQQNHYINITKLIVKYFVDLV